MSRRLILAAFALGCGRPAPHATARQDLGESHTVAMPRPDAAPVAEVTLVNPAAEPALEDDLPRLAGRFVAMYEDVGLAVTTAGEDCAAGVTAFAAIKARYADVAAANAAVIADHRQPLLQTELVPYQARLKAATHDAPLACARDARYRTALSTLLEAP